MTQVAEGDSQSRPAGPSTELKRTVGLMGLTGVSVGSVIGSGWLNSALHAVGHAGPAVLITWGVAALVCILLALNFAELGAAYPLSGGTARYSYLSFGALGGFFAGWISWLQAVALAPVEVTATMGYLNANWVKGTETAQGYLTTKGILIAIGFMAVFTFINLVGVKALAEGGNIIVAWKVFVPLLTIVVILAHGFHGQNFNAHFNTVLSPDGHLTASHGGGFNPYGLKGMLIALGVGGVLFSYQGFEQAVQLGGEAKNPKRDIPRAVVLSILIGTVVYIALQVCFIAAFNPELVKAVGWNGIQNVGTAFTNGHLNALGDSLTRGTGVSSQQLSDYATSNFGPFYGIATVAGLTWLAYILQVDAIVSPGGTGLVYLGTTSRLSYALSRQGMAPTSLGRLSRTQVPWVSVLLATVIGCLLFLPHSSNWSTLVGDVTSATFFMYALAPIAVVTLRKALPNRERPYNLPAAQFWAPVSFVIANLIIYWSNFETNWRIAVAIVAGVVLMFIGRVTLPDALRETLHWKAVAWIPVWVGGLVLLSYLGGSYVDGRGTIGFYYDMVVVAAFSLIIFYWAISSCLPAAEVEANYRKMQSEADLEEETFGEVA
jgi:amino acid transporter